MQHYLINISPVTLTYPKIDVGFVTELVEANTVCNKIVLADGHNYVAPEGYRIVSTESVFNPGDQYVD